MNDLLPYLKGTIFSPTKTFSNAITNKELKKLLIVLIALVSVTGLTNWLIPIGFNPDAPEQSMVIINAVSKSSVIVTPILLIVGTFITHLISRLFSKKGTFLQLLLLEGLISVVFGFLDVALKILGLYVPQLNILNLPLLLWTLFLSVIAVSVVYKISRASAAIVIVLQFILFGVIGLLLAMSVFS